MRHETLKESSASVLTLTPAQAEGLSAAGRRLASDRPWWGLEELPPDRTVIRCEPLQDRRWQVTVVDAVGTIVIDDLQLSVQPKIPQAHLLHLLALSERFPRLDRGRGWLSPADSLWDLVAEWYVAAAEHTLSRQLRRDYALTTDGMSDPKGRLLPEETAYGYYLGRRTVACEYDEYSEDHPLNRVLKAASLTVLRSPALRPDVRRRARRVIANFGEVGSLQPADLRVRVDRRTTHYRDSLELAHHVIASTGRTLDVGLASAWTFLIRTPELVEAGIRILLRDHIGIQGVDKQSVTLRPTSMTLNPDLVFRDSEVIADVKYKVATGDWKRPDMYQAIAFAEGFRARHAAIIEFDVAGMPPLPDIAVGDIRLRHICWEARPDLMAADAAQRLTTAVYDWLEGCRPTALAAH